MPNFEVWLDTDAALGLFPRGFEHAADVEAENADDVYGKTQNAETSWVDEKDVTLMRRGGRFGARSTSVGDVLVNTATDEHLAVDSVGFRVF